MALINWNDNYSVKVYTIDEQHKKLVALINDLHEAMKAGKAKDKLGTILNELVSYTVYHFQTEESFFKKTNYPESADHQKKHNDLVDQVKEVKAKFDSGTYMLANDVMNFLKDWLINHIQKTDKKFGEFILQNGLKI